MRAAIRGQADQVDTGLLNPISAVNLPRWVWPDLPRQGKRLDQAMVEDFARSERLLLLCGHYEGIDERVRATVQRIAAVYQSDLFTTDDAFDLARTSCGLLCGA